MNLTGKRLKFCEEYVNCLNKTEAARLANYAHPGQAGYRLFKNVEIQAEIKRLFEERAMTSGEVLERMARMARSSMEDFVRVAEGNKPQIDWEGAARAGALDNLKKITIKDGEISFELHDKQAALVHLGRHLGLWNRVELTGANGGPIELIDAKERLARLLAGRDAAEQAQSMAGQPDDRGGTGDPV